MEEEEEIDPETILELFTQGINSDIVQEKIFTAENMWLIAAALGPENTRSKLLPFLSQGQVNFDAEVQSIIARQLGIFVKYVGGSQYAHVLLTPLKQYLATEDTFVREKAIRSVVSVCSQISTSSSDTIVMNLFNDLFLQQTDKSATLRISACILLPDLYDLVSDLNKAKLRRYFISCTRKEETPILRRAALHSIPALLNVMKQNVVMNEVVRQILEKNVNDDDESVRVMIPGCLPAAAAKVLSNDRQNILVPIARTLSKDSSWWVRANMAKALSMLVPYFASDLIGSDIGSIILYLLRDLDPEVKTAAVLCCKQSIEYLAKVPQFFNDSIIPEITELSNDRFKQVREEVAKDILIFTKITDEEIEVEQLYPVMVSLLSDNERDIVIALLRSLKTYFTEVDSYAVTQAIFPKLLEISTKVDFRIKIEIIQMFCSFLQYINQEAFTEQIIPVIQNWMEDSVFIVRDEICKVLPDIIIRNPEAKDFIISTLMKLNYSPIYSVRQSSLSAVWNLCNVLSAEDLSERVLPSVILMASDQVPNVRILAAKTLVKLLNFADEKGKIQVNVILKLLKNDSDPDVRYFADQANV
ncbi:Serine/threonine-protein phosphatase 2A 65 kDa regulatory subunit A beta isoform [Histomonas meleagridis]|uniref:Serine/threonine-protein phosphatase 2A 65 kDa regulatory subunit A beta isoform n=1 Tax=Histomonas meleagridis TaxID=135588 RepID=UPI003559D304|nr:Serine/threonine-protein phosphatase 2A 65 kDa regulatory subunit A beta isoform [Histomonas meleagridis]KAH0803683.1 Serine/threonine-protein phosphatase 2A 65 kDa regulatory subunit A beta isoform [Histomonas meleagridis]